VETSPCTFRTRSTHTDASFRFRSSDRIRNTLQINHKQMHQSTIHNWLCECF